MKLTIKITKEVLEKTMMCRYVDVENCAIAYACREIFPGAAVTGNGIYLHHNDTDKVDIRFPSVAARFVVLFDSLASAPEKRLLLPEFSFTINVPDSVIESIGIEEAKAIIEKSSTLELA